MFKSNWFLLKVLIFIVTLFITVQVTSDLLIAQKSGIGSTTGLPIPRFVSLKSDEINVRNGPRKDHGIKWKFVRKGIPVEIIEEFDIWRRVRDWEGQTGWVHGNLLTGVRTVLIKPWGESENVQLRDSPSDTAKVIAEVEPLVLANISECTQSWCEITARDRDLNGRWRGWIEQNQLFGVYPDETIE